MTVMDRELVAEFVDRLALADRFGAMSRAQELVLEGTSRATLIDVISEAQREVGRLWQVNAWTVAQEHAATAVSEAVLQSISITKLPTRDRGHIAVVCADGEWHVLPARLLAERLSGADYRVTFVGGSVPPEHLHDYLPSLGVDAVAISCTLSLNLPGAARTVAAVHATGIPALVGGAGFGEDDTRARAIGADAWAPDPSGAIEILERWMDDTPVVAATPRLSKGEHAILLRDQRDLVDEALAELEQRLPHLADYSPWQRDRTEEDLGYHLRYLAAAILVGDGRVYTDMIPWLTDLLVARGVPPSAVHASLDTLEAVLARYEMPEALRIVTGAHEVVPKV